MYSRHRHRRGFLLTMAWTLSALYRRSNTQLYHTSGQSIQMDHSIRRPRAVQPSTCILNGVTYQTGESLGNSFVTRCGSVLEWPCYCAPGKNPPADCPYCSMADLDQGLVCAKDGETVSIVNLNGISQSCSCSVSIDGIPQDSCVDEDTENNNDDQYKVEEFCTIQVANGTTMSFENGESLGELLPTRCPGGGSAYPCYCNTALEDQVDCPYCTWVDFRGDLICSRQAESIFYERAPGEYVECACSSDFISSCKSTGPTSPPVWTPLPSKQPTFLQGTVSPSRQQTLSPTIVHTSLSSPPMLSPVDTTAEPIITPTQSPSTGPGPSSFTSTPSFATTFEKDILIGEDRPPLSDPELGGCLYLNNTSGNVEFVQEGATFGPNVHGPCSPIDEWPVICNPAIPNGGMEYPYCAFPASSSGAANQNRVASSVNSNPHKVVCARTEERVLVPFEDGITEECSCLYFNPFLGPSSSCPMVPINLSSPPFTPEDGTPPYGDLFPSPMPQVAAPSNSIEEEVDRTSCSSIMSARLLLVLSTFMLCLGAPL
jgi:hypothetical protein